MGLGAITIWNDTNGIFYDSGHIYCHDVYVCQGDMFDPAAAILNGDPDQAYVGQMYISDTDAYEVDSVELFGVYLYNSTKSTEVDTLRMVFMTGDGKHVYDNFFPDTSTRKGHYGVCINSGFFYDAVQNTGTGKNLANLYPATVPHYMDILLDNTTRNDTLPGGIWHKTIAVNGALGMKDSAGFKNAITITYISGDPATHTGILSTPTPGDTLVGKWHGWGNSKYNVWCPLVAYYAKDSIGVLTPAFAPYPCPTYDSYNNDANCGFWKSLPNDTGFSYNSFLPLWSFGLPGGGACAYQYPYISWYVSSCPTCGLVLSPLHALAVNNVSAFNKVAAYPNPVADELNVTFSLSQASDVSVTLTNILGQVVANQKLDNMVNGKAVFNTSVLAGGVYIYTLSADGDRNTGCVIIAH